MLCGADPAVLAVGLTRDDFRRGERLAHVTVRVIASMREQPDHRGGQFRASDLAPLEQRIDWRAPELIHRAGDGGAEIRTQLAGSDAIGTQGLFPRKHGELPLGKCFTTRIGEQSIEAAHGVTDMESHRRGSGGTTPEQVRGQPSKQVANIVIALDEGVRHVL